MTPDIKTLNTPDNSNISQRVKLAYPIYRIILISKMHDYVRNLNYLNSHEVKRPKNMPIIMLNKNSLTNSQTSSSVNIKSKCPSDSFSESNSIETNIIIATASLTIPSPNTTLNNFGYLSALIIVKAATESVAQIVAENIIISLVPNFATVSSPQMWIKSFSLMRYVNENIITKLTTVPINPNRLI